MRKPFKLLARDTNGSVLIESAIALPILFMFGFGIIEISRAMWIQNTMQFAVEAAARCAAIDANRCSTDQGVQTVATNAATGLTIPSTSYLVNRSASCGRQVSVSQSFDGNIPGMSAFAPTLTASACFPV